MQVQFGTLILNFNALRSTGCSEVLPWISHARCMYLPRLQVHAAALLLLPDARVLL